MTLVSRARILDVMRALALFVLLACTSSTLPPIVAPPATITTTTWVQVWSDEFDGPAGASIDSTKWGYDTTDGCTGGNCGWGNNEKEYYTSAPGNVALNGQGQLTIEIGRAH